MDFGLGGKVAVVTGAARGIGREIALTLAQEKVKVIVLDVNQNDLDEVKNVFAERGYEGAQFQCDVTNFEQIKDVVGQIVDAFGRIDILVNNAGIGPTGKTVETLPEDGWDRIMDVNLKGTFLMCKGVIPVMKQQRSGRIINAASFAAIVPSVRSAAYAASKGAVVSFTRVLAGELGPWNITVNSYAPGMIPTELNHFASLNPDAQGRLLDTLTLRRWGEKREVAHLICFLASDLAGYITGTLVDVSGGKLATQIPAQAYEQLADGGQ